MELKRYIRDIPDYPRPGIVFKDLTPLLQDSRAFASVIGSMADIFRGRGIAKVCGIESRGFIFGAALALSLEVGFVPARKPGKLPWKTLSEEYSLEYGTDRLEIHDDAVTRGERTLVVDDLLATGGTAAAACRLLTRLDAEVVACAFVIELAFLNGRRKLSGVEATSLVQY